MDYGKAFTFFTEDERWVTKLLIAGLLVMFSWLIIPIFLLLGYTTEVLQNVAHGNPRPLPEWDNVGAKFAKGLSVFVIGIVYALPLILFACCFVGLTSVLSGSSSGARGSNDTGNTIVSLLSICFACFALLYSIVVAVMAPAAITLYAVTERLGAAFKFREVLAYIQRNASNYLIALLLGIVAGFLAQFGAIACFIGVFFTTAWSQVVQNYLLGQVYFNSLNPPPPAPSPVLTPTSPAM